METINFVLLAYIGGATGLLCFGILLWQLFFAGKAQREAVTIIGSISGFLGGLVIYIYVMYPQFLQFMSTTTTTTIPAP